MENKELTQLIYVFVFPYVDCWFSGAAAHIKATLRKLAVEKV